MMKGSELQIIQSKNPQMNFKSCLFPIKQKFQADTCIKVILRGKNILITKINV